MLKNIRVRTFVGLTALLLVVPVAAHCQPAVCIGVYDSQAAAPAYCNPAGQRQVSQDLQAECQGAKAAGDEARQAPDPLHPFRARG